MALQKEVINTIVQTFKINEYDTGSIEVQIALLTHGINELNDHCIKNPKDFSTKRGLLRMVCRRKKFLLYLKGKNVQSYKNVIEKLGLRK